MTRAVLMRRFQEQHAKNVESGNASVPEQHATLAHAISWIKNLARGERGDPDHAGPTGMVTASSDHAMP
jgi:hypothetical protein